MNSKENNGNTYRIITHIKENPGCYFRQIKNNLHLSIGSIQYHLQKLERDGKIISERFGLYKHYFPVGIFKEHEKEIMRFLTQETPRQILMFIIENGGGITNGPTQTDIANKIEISSPSVNWHLKRLLYSNLIKETKDGKYKRYILNPEINSLYIARMLQTYYPNIWDKWSNRLAEMFLSLSSFD